MLTVIFNAPWMARQFVSFPLDRVWVGVSFALAVVVMAAWFVPGLRNAVFLRDAEQHGGKQRVCLVAIGFTVVGFFLLALGPLGALEALE